ncbi:hypothetical protein A145_04925 [Vibrio splendidus 5S-101]|uniref:Panacea domain-containing protein n=1 Tax=Vibrio splendidus TaxID=29497 RepID=UPI00035F6FB4|nr:Panacea domain-containing protein [Vibrio splendidus]OEF21054.1 hypothetical protein A145_04925 [Vibrio splendidus 5S-101]
MNSIQLIVAYYCLNYPYPSELSNARITKLVYLADWYSALGDGETLTNIQWLFNHYGPYVDDVINNVKFNSSFTVTPTQTTFGSEKSVISFRGMEIDVYGELSARTRQILDLVIEKTKDLYFNDFIDYVYSTYPVRAQNRYAVLNLVQLASEYKSLQNNN